MQYLVLHGAHDFGPYESQTRSEFYANDALGILEGTEPEPPALVLGAVVDGGQAVQQAQVDARALEITAHRKKRLQGWRYFNMTMDAQLATIKDAVELGDVTALWAALQHAFRNKSMHALSQELQSVMVANQQGMSVLQAVGMFRQHERRLASIETSLNAANALRPVGERISTREMIIATIFLSTLPAEMSTYVGLTWSRDHFTLNSVFEGAIAADQRNATTRKLNGHNGTITGRAHAIQAPIEVAAPAGSMIISARDAAKEPKIVVGTDSAGNRKSLLCTYCNKNGHIYDTCYALHPEMRGIMLAKKAEAAVAASRRAQGATSSSAKAVSTVDMPPMQEFDSGFCAWTAQCIDFHDIPPFQYYDEEDMPPIQVYEDESSLPAFQQYDQEEALIVTYACSVSTVAAGCYKCATVGPSEQDPGSISGTFDTGATGAHYLQTTHGVSNLSQSMNMLVQLADGSQTPPEYSGTLMGMPVQVLSNFPCNLFSAGVLDDAGFECTIPTKDVPTDVIHRSTGRKAGFIVRHGHAYSITLFSPPSSHVSVPCASRAKLVPRLPDLIQHTNATSAQVTAAFLHRCLHCNGARIVEAVNGNHFQPIMGVSKLTLSDFEFTCDACALARAKRPVHTTQRTHTKAEAPYKKVHIDWKDMRHRSWQGKNGALFIVDDYSGYTLVYPCESRADQIEVLRAFEGQVVRAHGYKLSCIHSDNAPEYTGTDMQSFLTERGIEQELTTPHTPQMNGRVERKIQTIMSTARACRIASNLPAASWDELLPAAAFIENVLPTTANEQKKSAYEMLNKKPFNTSVLHPIGTKVVIHIDPSSPLYDKFGPAGSFGVLVGYGKGKWRVARDTIRGQVIETDRVAFYDRKQDPMPTVSTPEQVINNEFYTSEIVQWIVEPSDATIEATTPIGVPPPVQGVPVPPAGPAQQYVIPPPREQRARVPNQMLSDSHVYGVPHSILPGNAMSVKLIRWLVNGQTIDVLTQPIHGTAYAAKIQYREAVKNPMLVESMKKELRHLIDSGAIQLVPKPDGCNVVSTTWAHKFKHDEENRPTYAKSRVCPRGFSQQVGIDYNPDEVAAPTIMLASCMFMFAMQAVRSMFAGLFDVDAAFTIPVLKDDVYMEIPLGMERVPGHVLKLNTSLNGLKQSAYNWHEMAKGFLLSVGFVSSVVDPCFFIRWSGQVLSLVGLYVDDFRAQFDLEEDKVEFKDAMKKVFPIKELTGEHYLGMKVIHDREAKTVSVTHEAYITNMLARFNMSDCHGVHTPAVPGSKLKKFIPGVSNEADDPSNETYPYREAVGALLWLARCTKPEMLYAVNQCAAHCNNIRASHVAAVKRLMQYAKETIKVPLIYRHNPEGVELYAYSDADFCGEPEESDHPMKSLSGLVVYLKGIGYLYGQSSLQTTVSRSTAEAEYRAAGSAVQVVLGFRNLMKELNFKQDWPTTIWGDNEACLKMVKSAVSGSNLRHIKLDHHFIRQAVKDQEICMVACSTEDMVADIMTKALAKEPFTRHANTIRSGL